jgi:hypothetical protein
MTTPTLTIPQQPRRQVSVAFPLVLISLGLAFLLVNLGVLHGITWAQVFRLWPVLIILAGVDLLLRPRSYLAAAVVDIAIIVAAFAYLMSGATIGPANLSYTVNVPRAGVTDLGLTVNYGAGAFTLSGGASDLVAVSSSSQDISRTVDQSGARATVVVSSDTNTVFGVDGRDRQWSVRIPSDVRTSMTLNLGAGDFDVDLSSVKLTRGTINAGASDLTITLPKPTGNVPLKISSGASSVTIIVPAGVAYSVSTTGVLHSVSGPQQSSDYATASDRVSVEVSIAAGSVVIR